jgi:hypothetical protein
VRSTSCLKGAPQLVDVQTCLKTVYVVVDEYDKAQRQAQLASPPARHPGCAPAWSRSEVVRVAIVGPWAPLGRWAVGAVGP